MLQDLKAFQGQNIKFYDMSDYLILKIYELTMPWESRRLPKHKPDSVSLYLHSPRLLFRY